MWWCEFATFKALIFLVFIAVQENPKRMHVNKNERNRKLKGGFFVFHFYFLFMKVLDRTKHHQIYAFVLYSFLRINDNFLNFSMPVSFFK